MRAVRNVPLTTARGQLIHTNEAGFGFFCPILPGWGHLGAVATVPEEIRPGRSGKGKRGSDEAREGWNRRPYGTWELASRMVAC